MVVRGLDPINLFLNVVILEHVIRPVVDKSLLVAELREHFFLLPGEYFLRRLLKSLVVIDFLGEVNFQSHELVKTIFYKSLESFLQLRRHNLSIDIICGRI